MYLVKMGIISRIAVLKLHLNGRYSDRSSFKHFCFGLRAADLDLDDRCQPASSHRPAGRNTAAGNTSAPG